MLEKELVGANYPCLDSLGVPYIKLWTYSPSGGWSKLYGFKRELSQLSSLCFYELNKTVNSDLISCQRDETPTAFSSRSSSRSR